jgi:hypothetical protein
MSFYQNEVPAGSLRINLRWEGNHEITDFELDQFGDFVSCETETEHTGWVIVKPRGAVYFGDTIPLLKRPNNRGDVQKNSAASESGSVHLTATGVSHRSPST